MKITNCCGFGIETNEKVVRCPDCKEWAEAINGIEKDLVIDEVEQYAIDREIDNHEAMVNYFESNLNFESDKHGE